jgi:hypothetical protein
MILRNGKVHRLEAGVPGIPRMYHLDIHRACDRFLAKRGLVPAPDSRRNTWLFGRKAK